jgi:hypothetical protein
LPDAALVHDSIMERDRSSSTFEATRRARCLAPRAEPSC